MESNFNYLLDGKVGIDESYIGGVQDANSWAKSWQKAHCRGSHLKKMYRRNMHVQ